MPRPKAGWGFIKYTSTKVRNGRARNCEKIPANTPLGFWLIDLKSLGCIPKAIPNMIKPRHILRAKRLSSEKLIFISSTGVNTTQEYAAIYRK
jgi:hypothetical protein